MNCPLCGGPADIVAKDYPGYRESSRFDLYGCSGCGSAFAWPMTVDESIYECIYNVIERVPGYNRYYQYCLNIVDEKSPLDFLCGREESYWAVGNALRERRRKNGRVSVLEIGSGLGYFTYALNRDGFDAVGIDLSQDAVDQASRRFGPHYFRSGQDIVAISGRSRFDVLVMNQLIEHVPDIHRLLEETLAMLADGGEILVTTPNRSAFPRSTWDSELPPVHLWWLGETSLRHLAERHRLDVRFVDFTDFYANHYRQRDPEGPPRPGRSVLDANGRIIAPLDPKDSRNPISLFLDVTGLLATARAVRDLLTGRKRWRGGRGPILCAVFTRKAEAAS